MKRVKDLLYIGLPMAGVLFYLYYLHIAAIDMVYSDYIRLINSYLPDVWNPEKFFVADLLTRIPINYLERIVNVTLFGYSVTFDRVLGVMSFGVSAFIVAWYCRKQELSLVWYTAIMVFMFSLNKWEMLYNGTGWAHFFAFACFFYHYVVVDQVYQKGAKKRAFILLLLLPAVITIGIAGPYCAIYSMTLILTYSFMYLRAWWMVSKNTQNARNKKDTWKSEDKKYGLTGKSLIILLASVMFPLFAYIWSNSQAVYEHAGAVEGSLLGTFFQEPEFFLKFLLKAFASVVFGVEFISRRLGEMPDMAWYLLGFLVMAAYVLAVWMNVYYRIYEKTLFPLMLLAGGGMNHLIVMVSRWIFMKDTYGMSSRYALQYQVGILGILLTFGLVWKLRSVQREMEGQKKTQSEQAEAGRSRKLSSNRCVNGWCCILAVFVSLVILTGNILTTVEEFDFGQHRKNHNLEVREILLNFEQEDEAVLRQKLEYNKPGTKEALRILKENGWNIFKE